MDFNQIYNEDCITGMQKLPDNCIDLCITSPPYNLGVKYDVYNDWMGWDVYYDWCERWLQEVYRVLKPDGRFCLNHYLSCGTSKTRSAPLMNLHCICNKIGFLHHGIALWDDRTLTKYQAWGSWKSASSPYVNSPHECILITYKDHWKKDRKGKTEISPKEFMEACSGVWKIHPLSKSKSLTMANFPVELPMRCIKLLSYKGDVVLDPFSGSGTTAYAAKVLGRQYVGFEISKNYWEISQKRVEQCGLDAWVEKDV
jgi:site-specific DNA-methyltransferase (adenine-specific)